MRPALNPFDIVVVNGLNYMPHHWPIMWRGLDRAAHCVTVINSDGEIWNPTFVGIKEGLKDGKMGHLDYYKGRYVTIHRYKGEIDHAALVKWGHETKAKSKGYDFWRQWFLGFICGVAVQSIANDEERWTCVEFPYWGLVDNGYQLTSRPEVLPMPRLVRYNDHVPCIFEGIL